MHKKKIVLLYFCFFCFMIFLKIIAKNYVINLTESLPRGVYKLSNYQSLKVGDIVQFQPKEETLLLIKERGYLPEIANTLLKIVAVTYENEEDLKIINNTLYVGKISYGKIVTKDSLGRDIPEINIEELKPKNKDEYLLLSPHLMSYDGRYFGLTKKKDILKTAKIILYFD